MPRTRMAKLLPWIVTPSLVILLIIAWQLFVTISNVNPFVFPPPADVGAAFVTLVTDPATWEEAGITVIEILAGFSIAVVLGIIVGVVLGKLPWLEVSIRPLIVIAQVAPKVAFIPLFVIWFGFGMTSKILLAALLAFFPVMLNVLLGKVPWLERSLRPLIVASQVVPKVALIPLFVIWFGFGMTSKVIMSAMLAFFPIMLNVQLGVRSVEAGQRDVMRSLNASRWATFRHLDLKSTMPYVFAGMEVGIVFAIIGTIVGEYLGGSEGLGYLVVRTLNELNAPALFAVIILLSLLGLALYFIVHGMKRFVIPWHESVYREQDVNQ